VRHATAPSWYLEPTSQRILRMADREGLYDLTLDEQDLIIDLCNHAVGAKVRKFDGRAFCDEAAVYAEEKLSGFAWRAGLDFDEEAGYLTKYAEEYIGFRRSMHDILTDYDLEQIPGTSLLQKAVRLAKLLRSMRKFNQGMSWLHPPNAFQCLLEAMTKADELCPHDHQLLKEFYGHEQDDETVMLVAEFAIQHVDLNEMLRIARCLDGISELQRPMAIPHPDPNGEDMVQRGIQDLGELLKAGASAFVLPKPLLMYRAVTGQLSIREPVTRRDKRQLLYCIIDGTGSMQGGAAGRAAGVILNRLQAVVDGDAELYLRFFHIDLLDDEYHANSPESAASLMQVVTSPLSYLGNDTAFTEPLISARKRVQELVSAGNLRDEEIVMVTDGVAPVPSVKILGGTKLHVIQVGDHEIPDLSHLAMTSGGANLWVGEPMPAA
jgi:hypothetical protein